MEEIHTVQYSAGASRLGAAPGAERVRGGVFRHPRASMGVVPAEERRDRGEERGADGRVEEPDATGKASRGEVGSGEAHAGQGRAAESRERRRRQRVLVREERERFRGGRLRAAVARAHGREVRRRRRRSSRRAQSRAVVGIKERRLILFHLPPSRVDDTVRVQRLRVRRTKVVFYESNISSSAPLPSPRAPERNLAISKNNATSYLRAPPPRAPSPSEPPSQPRAKTTPRAAKTTSRGTTRRRAHP